MAIEVTVIDTRTTGHWLASFTRIGEIEMTSAADMVARVVAKLEATRERPPANAQRPNSFDGMVAARPSRLNILDHGNEDELEIGDDVVDTGTFARFRPSFARLAGRFAPGGFAHLQHCEAAMNIRLMEMFADCWQAPVVGGRGLEHMVYGFNRGNYVRVHPARPDGSRPPPDTFFWRP
jgi:hypothetical protein